MKRMLQRFLFWAGWQTFEPLYVWRGFQFKCPNWFTETDKSAAIAVIESCPANMLASIPKYCSVFLPLFSIDAEPGPNLSER